MVGSAVSVSEWEGSVKDALRDPGGVTLEMVENWRVMLAEIGDLSTRDDAETVLEAGVLLWNEAIGWAGTEDRPRKVAVHVKHVAVEAMAVASVALGGISAKYDIDDATLLKLFASCGRHYCQVCGDVQGAKACFARADEFSMRAGVGGSHCDPVHAKALFDVEVGKAECAWEEGKIAESFEHVERARALISWCPKEAEYLSSLMYNFGFYLYDIQKVDLAFEWLENAITMRESLTQATLWDQGRSTKLYKLAGLCCISMQQFEKAESYDDCSFLFGDPFLIALSCNSSSARYIDKSLEIVEDPVGRYLMVKCAIYQESNEVKERLECLCKSAKTNIQLSLSALVIAFESGYEEIALSVFAQLIDLFPASSCERCEIEQRYFEVLMKASRLDAAKNMLITALERDRERASDATSYRRTWSSLVLRAGGLMARQRRYAEAAEILSVPIDGVSCMRSQADIFGDNERLARLLAASCALHSLTEKSGGAQNRDLREKLGSIARLNAKKILDKFPNDVEAGTLYFRSLLVTRDFVEAKKILSWLFEVLGASPEALASIALDARSVGLESVFVKCIEALVSLEASELDVLPSGFLGASLVSAIRIEYENFEINHDGPEETPNRLLKLLKAAARLLRADAAFRGGQQASLTSILSDIAWNMGVYMNENGTDADCAEFFRSSADFSEASGTSSDSTRAAITALLMEVSSLISLGEKEPSTALPSASRAVDSLDRVERLACERLSGCPQDEISGLLESRALFQVQALCLGGDEKALDRIMPVFLDRDDLEPMFAWKLGGALLSSTMAKDRSCANSIINTRRSVHLHAVSCLKMAHAGFMSRLANHECDDSKSFEELILHAAVTLRESLSLVAEVNEPCALDQLKSALPLLQDSFQRYPVAELRWIVCFAWERAQSLACAGCNADAAAWATEALALVRIAGGVAGLTEAETSLCMFIERMRPTA